MAICEGFLPRLMVGRKGMTGGKCGAMSEPSEKLCSVHLKQSGYRKCDCGRWMPPAPVNVPYGWKCPGCGTVLELPKE